MSKQNIWPRLVALLAGSMGMALTDIGWVGWIGRDGLVGKFGWVGRVNGRAGEWHESVGHIGWESAINEQTKYLAGLAALVAVAGELYEIVGQSGSSR